MKKLMMILCIIMSCMMIFNLSVYASDSPTDRVILNENQKNILRAYGCTDKDFESLTRAQLSKILSTGKIVNPEYVEVNLPSEPINKRDEKTDKLLKEKGYTEDFIRFIINHGYLYKEILDIDDNIMKLMIAEYEKVAPGKSTVLTIANFSSKNSLKFRNIYTSPIQEYAPFSDFQLWPDPPNYPGITGVGIQGYFHPWVSIRQSAAYYSSQCLSGAEDVFNTSSYLYYDYNIFGEDKGTTGCHEGVDLQYTGNNKEHAVYSVTPGIYNGTNITWGAVCVYDSNLGATSVYEHLKLIPTFTLGQTIAKEDLLGYEGITGMDSGGNHLHFEVHPNENYGSVTSGTWVEYSGDLTLKSAFPYAYLNWY
ncbi:MAG TPA: M23 family metallopeptidase [Oscillospiraceae bacterium]|nr:M23 family metallopeptidase [Oscillospiraceae bacterium]HPS35372.1 M23 family metallopeptidase [Oscillospiraceae bacterium]